MTATETPVRYRKKPIEVEARLFDPADYDRACAVVAWCGGHATDEGCEISTLEGPMLARPGDWIVKGVVGEFYPCRGDIFALTYEPAGDASQGEGAGGVSGGQHSATPSWCESNGWIHRGDGTTWPDPADPHEVEQKLRYGNPARGDLLWAAAVVSAYRHLMNGEQQ